MRTLFVMALLCVANLLAAQAIWKPGYRLNEQGDTLSGYLLQLSRREVHVNYIFNSTPSYVGSKQYTPDSSPGYGFSAGQHYVRQEVPQLDDNILPKSRKKVLRFILRINDGDIELYRWRENVGKPFLGIKVNSMGGAFTALVQSLSPVEFSFTPGGKVKLENGELFNQLTPGMRFSDSKGNPYYFIKDTVYVVRQSYRGLLAGLLSDCPKIKVPKDLRYTTTTILPILENYHLTCKPEKEFHTNSPLRLQIGFTGMVGSNTFFAEDYRRPVFDGWIQIRNNSFSPGFSVEFGVGFARGTGITTRRRIVDNGGTTVTDTLDRRASWNPLLVRMNYSFRPRKALRPFVFIGASQGAIELRDTYQNPDLVSRGIIFSSEFSFTGVLGAGTDYYFLTRHRIRAEVRWNAFWGAFIGYGIDLW